MSELVKAKERQLLDEIEDSEVELSNNKDFYSEYFRKIDMERDIVEQETEHNFEEDIGPYKAEFTQNEMEIEGIKEQIRQIKTQFERLRTNLIQDARHTEQSTLDQIKVEHSIQMQNLDAEIKSVVSQSENLKSRFESGSQMAQKMNQKLETSRQNLLTGEELLTKGLESTNNQLKGQSSELQELMQIRNNAQQVLDKDLHNLEELQNNLAQITGEKPFIGQRN